MASAADSTVPATGNITNGNHGPFPLAVEPKKDSIVKRLINRVKAILKSRKKDHEPTSIEEGNQAPVFGGGNPISKPTDPLTGMPARTGGPTTP